MLFNERCTTRFNLYVSGVSFLIRVRLKLNIQE